MSLSDADSELPLGFADHGVLGEPQTDAHLTGSGLTGFWWHPPQ